MKGNETVKIIRLGLNKRGFITGDSCKNAEVLNDRNREIKKASTVIE